MSDQNITATPYPFYATGDNDDSHKAALVSHASASIERNQDSQFAALSRQALDGRINDARRESVETKFEAVVAQKDAEIKAELASLRAEGLSRELVALRADTGNDKLASVLARIAVKLGA